MSDSDSNHGVGRRAGRRTTAQERAFKDETSLPPDGAMEPDATGVSPSEMDDFSEGYQQPTAMFDRGEFLGELADLVDGSPDTRAAVEAEPKPPAGCRLIVVSGPDIGMEWSFKKQEVQIGRGAENDLDFSDIGVSRHHARITLDGMHFYLSDLSSNNGTFLNGEKVDNDQLTSGDEIVLGARTLRFVELNDAPPTAAAHPIADPPSEPVAGRPSEIISIPDSDDEPSIGGEGSQFDVPELSEVLDPGSRVDVPEVQPAKKGSLGKLLVTSVLALALLGGLGVMGYRVVQTLLGESSAQKAERAQREFLQGIELVKSERFGDALVLFNDVLVLRPEYTRAKEYAAHCEEELEQWRLLTAGRKLAAVGRHEEALFKLREVGASSAYRDDADKDAAAWARVVGRAKVAEARVLMAAGDLEGAAEMLRETLKEAPGLKKAIALLAEIDAIRNPAPTKKAPVKKSAPRVPEAMVRAVSLYRSDRVSAAIDAAEAAGGPSAPVYMERMRRAKTMLSEAEVAHRAKAMQEVLSLAPKLLELDRQIALGKGKIQARVRGYYADALYVKGLEAQQDGDFAKSYKLLNEALKVLPGHALSKNRLRELSKKAQELYYQGYVQKDTNPDETRKVFRRIMQMTRPDNQFHQWASKWLAQNGN